MKVIFLDIDGVLNVCYPKRDGWGSLFHPHLVANLKRVIDATNAKIVISSTWRHSGLNEMRDMWIARDLPGCVFDITPDHGRNAGRDHLPFKDRAKRGGEIKEWLDNNAVEKYIILDDDDDVLAEQEPYFVQTSGNTHHSDCVDAGYGLTTECADKAIMILNSL